MRDWVRALGAALALSAAAHAGGDESEQAPLPKRAPAVQPAPAAGDCAAAVTARVQARYDRMHALEAQFTQRTHSALSPSGDVTTGHVALAKPGKMRWSYETPEPSLVVSDGATLWMYDPRAREAQKLTVGEQFLSGAAFQFLLGRGRIADEFRVAASGCGGPRPRLTLTPKTDASYQTLELEVDAASGEALATAVVDLFGNRTEVEFRDVQYDPGLAADVFRFTPGPGVRVIELAPAPR